MYITINNILNTVRMLINLPFIKNRFQFDAHYTVFTGIYYGSINYLQTIIQNILKHKIGQHHMHGNQRNQDF